MLSVEDHQEDPERLLLKKEIPIEEELTLEIGQILEADKKTTVTERIMLD